MQDRPRDEFMRRALELARLGMSRDTGGPFGAVVVRDGQVIGEGCNAVTSTNDPTAHAEIVAIRNACKHLAAFQLTGCDIYTSCEPCPMCLGAIYWARPARIFYGCTRQDAAAAGFDDSQIYDQLELPVDARSIPMQNHLRDDALAVFRMWLNKADRVEY